MLERVSKEERDTVWLMESEALNITQLQNVSFESLQYVIGTLVGQDERIIKKYGDESWNDIITSMTPFPIDPRKINGFPGGYLKGSHWTHFHLKINVNVVEVLILFI